MLSYEFKETEKIRHLVNEIEALKIVFATIKPLAHVEENIRRESLLKSSIYSARIEGNPLGMDDMKNVTLSQNSHDLKKIEVFNLQRAHNFIYGKNVPNNFDLPLIKKLHNIVMKGISANAGEFRTEPWGIFNPAGIAVYLAPAYFKIPVLMGEYADFGKNIKHEVPVKSAIMQFLFEKIHPFADGNGRVGRLLSLYILNQGGYGFRGTVSIEEAIDSGRESYYSSLEPSIDANPFVVFFLESFISQSKVTIEKLTQIREELAEDVLLPRRREIFKIIKDHPYCSFDLLSRRFREVNVKTLHYDLKKLQDDGFIIKVGKTRGVLYKVK